RGSRVRLRRPSGQAERLGHPLGYPSGPARGQAHRRRPDHRRRGRLLPGQVRHQINRAGRRPARENHRAQRFHLRGPPHPPGAAHRRVPQTRQPPARRLQGPAAVGAHAPLPRPLRHQIPPLLPHHPPPPPPPAHPAAPEPAASTPARNPTAITPSSRSPTCNGPDAAGAPAETPSSLSPPQPALAITDVSGEKKPTLPDLITDRGEPSWTTQ